MQKYKFLFHVPHLNTIYAGRTIMNGYRSAILDLGHQFEFMTADTKDQDVFLDTYKPDMLFISLNKYPLKYLDLKALKKAQKNGTKVFVNTPFWRSPISKSRINEASSLSEDKALLELILKQKIGDIYYNVCEQNDLRMDGFEKTTGIVCHTVSLAADKIVLKGVYDKKFKADISFIGTNLPQKKEYFKQTLFPLKRKYDLKLYGQDWYLSDKILGWIQRGGQYFNIPILKNAQKPKVDLKDEAKIYKSSLISVNIHEDYQRKFGGDCNERTFKIPLSGGFEITDNIQCIKKYFVEGKEIIIAENKKDWFDKIDYYYRNPEKRIPIIETGMARVLKEHTYHNRVEQLINLLEGLN